MKLRYTRILSLLLCAALACSILAGCGGSTASSSEAPSSASSSASSAASGEDLPDSTTRADTSGLNPGDFDENSIFSITGTAAAFEPCLGWGPGVSGCSDLALAVVEYAGAAAEAGETVRQTASAIETILLFILIMITLLVICKKTLLYNAFNDYILCLLYHIFQ